MVGRKLFHPIMKKGPKFEHEVSVAGKAIFFGDYLSKFNLPIKRKVHLILN